MGSSFLPFSERFLAFVLGHVVFPRELGIRETRGVHLLSARGNFTLSLGTYPRLSPARALFTTPTCSAI